VFVLYGVGMSHFIFATYAAMIACGFT